MWETYSAFANSSGGDIFLGLKEKKGSFELAGIENTGNIFDFYRWVIRKLEEGLKIPFSVKNNIRQDDTLTHQAVREALINCLVHADYSDRASIKVTKSSKGFYFRNPGMMRIPAEIALEGGVSDCRNQTLHKLFLLIGLGERAGSGLPKIKQGWIAQGHLLELYDKNTPFNQTIIELNWFVPEEMSDTFEGAASRPESRPESIINRVLHSLVDNEYSKSQIAEAIGHKSISGKLNQRIRGLLSEGLVEYTIPEKPNSRLQKYRLTDAGRKYLEMSIGS